MCAYFAPFIDKTGLRIPTFNDILEKRMMDARAIFGQDIYLDNDSLDYQMLSVESLSLYECMQALQLAYNQISPATAIGAGLSSLVQINGVRRRAATFSTCDVVLTGTTSATIVDGVVVDKAGYKWSLPSPITLQLDGDSYTLTVTATCQTIGSISALANDISVIDTPVKGWTGVNNPTAAIEGLPIETDSSLRERQNLSVALPSQTMLFGTIAGIASLDGVTRYVVYENPTNSSNGTDEGVPFDTAPPHSITAVVEGGSIEEIAEVIYNNRGLGCYTNGDVITSITDLKYGSITPIRFFRPEYVPIYVEVEIKPLAGYAEEMKAEILDAVNVYINSLDIGETLVVSSIIYAAVDTIVDKTNPTFSVRSIKIGIDPSDPPLSSSDVEVTYKQVVTCVPTNISITEV